MSALAGILSSVQGDMARAAAESTAGALVAGLWQSTLLVAGVWLALKVVPRTTAAVRFAIWTVVFCVSVAMPVASVLFGRQAAAATESASGLRVDSGWSYLIAGVWIAATFVRLAQLAVQVWKLCGLWRRAVHVAAESRAAMGCDDLQLRGRKVLLCTSEDVDRPSVIGFFAPRILVPVFLFEQISATELRHIVLHELEHLRRRDDWLNLLQKIGLVLFPLNPALFWVDRRLAAEREHACDDGVLRQTQMRRAYASCLASVAELRLLQKTHLRGVALALGVFGTVTALRGRSELSRRIESILSRRAVLNPVATGLIAAVLVGGVFGAGAELVRAPQLVSFAPSAALGAVAEVATPSGSLAGVRVLKASFRLPERTVDGSSGTTATMRDAAFVMRSKGVPQRLKPQNKCCKSGTAEAVPLSKARFSASGQAVRRINVANGQSNQVDTAKAQTSRSKEQRMVPTSFDEDAPVRIVVRSEDGKFYLTPYAAIPVRDGWLIVQL